MPTITLPDGSKRTFAEAVDGSAVAKSIGARLERDAVAVRVNGKLKDLTLPIEDDASIEIVTRTSKDGLELLRHDAAHVMAEAVKELYPETQVTIGPAIENGFYYDFARKEPFTPEDLEKIEKRMHEIVARDEKIVREVWDRDRAIEFFKSQGEAYKAEIIGSIPAGEQISLYRQGDFIDLCRGPHLPSTGRLGAGFKLTKLAGAYWRGNSDNEMLQRVYGTAWSDAKELKAYIERLEEAERRDHRKLGRAMDLFHFQDEAVGAVFWHQKGWSLFRTLVEHLRARQVEAGYREVNTPELMARSLWEASGHWATFGESMFTSTTADDQVFAVKPMNCPGHVQIFKNDLRSYRDLPYRVAEFGKVHRYEPSGALHGLMRVRAFTQDDAHIFCTEEQITAETGGVCRLLLEIYRDFGFTDVIMKFADRPPKRVGDDAVWDRAEAALTRAMDALDLKYSLNKGEGRVLRPQDRVRAARCDRPRLAVRHAASRSQPTRAPRSDLHRRGRQPSHAGAAAPRDLRIARAFHRHLARALCRRAAVLARSAASGRRNDHVRRGPVCGASGAGPYRGRIARGGRSAQREDQLQGARAQSREGARVDRGGQARGRREHGRDSAVRSTGPGGPAAGASDRAAARGGRGARPTRGRGVGRLADAPAH